MEQLNSHQHASQNFTTGLSAPFHAILEATVNLPCTCQGSGLLVLYFSPVLPEFPYLVIFRFLLS